MTEGRQVVDTVPDGRQEYLRLTEHPLTGYVNGGLSRSDVLSRAGAQAGGRRGSP